MHRQTRITIYTASVETRETLAVVTGSQPAPVDTPAHQPEVRKAKTQTRDAARTPRGLFKMLAALVKGAVRELIDRLW